MEELGGRSEEEGGREEGGGEGGGEEEEEGGWRKGLGAYLLVWRRLEDLFLGGLWDRK